MEARLLPNCIPEFDFKCGVRLTENITIFTAELTAIKLALLWISENSDRVSSSRDISLYSDSLSALQAIKNEHTDCRPNMLNEIYAHVKSITNKIALTWIPSHVGIKGIKGNEMADRTAQHAIANQSVQVEVGLELKEINHCILQYINEKWQHIWTTTATGQFLPKNRAFHF